ncbi:hypothetical protein GCM10011581_07310 [Saccharopolyspora subtropica]|uniref:Uncharacterized protein n=1 Tax=Saccharopolyspora thermophila TaxID=89367 RepID=A0A917JJN5_9PSEU|nr:hypothetical protein [Saccharopolyspora subtropica]GGI72891.1 hypothetical protein GCM10011581_07310 [Saccharopolyspora subtropica]
MTVLRMLAVLSVLGGVVSSAVVWSHGHPHDVWSPWTLLDLVAAGAMLAGLRYVNRLISAEPPAARLAAVLAETGVVRAGGGALHGRRARQARARAAQ